MKINTTNSGFALITGVLIIFGLLVVGGGVYYATQSSNQNTNLDFGMESVMNAEDMNEAESGQESVVVTTNSTGIMSNNTSAQGDDVNGQHIGYVTSVSGSGNNYSLVIDYIEWITDCTPNTQNGSCMNGFQIVNNNPMLRTFPISSNASIKTFNTDWEQVNITVQQFVDSFSNDTTYSLNWITLENGVVVEITPQYTP